ncbi:MAG: hypothetical protein DRP76_02410 [Candidatus Omnitrophota bacterium]|nr:MAG: hypothetical protein DRP76_02410 [Candidatus Omnitrophota bacterium]
MCLNKKDFILFFYKELDEHTLNIYREHLKNCPRCLEEYEKLESLLNSIRREEIVIPAQEKEKAISQVLFELKKYSYPRSFFKDLKERIIQHILWRPVLISLAILLLLVVPWGIKKLSLKKDFSILETELLLSLNEMEALTIFDKEDIEEEVSFLFYSEGATFF